MSQINADIKLWLIHFQDENGIHFIHSPHLDLTGYGKSIEEAKASFEIAIQDFLEYTLENQTLEDVLSDLGWVLKKNTNEILTPGITTVIKNNKFVSEIFDKYPVNSYHEVFDVPIFV